MLYLSILLIILLLTYQYDIKSAKQDKWLFYWSLCFIFICLSGFRYHIGIDPLFYEESWDTYPDFWNFNWRQDIENFQRIPATSRYHIGWIFYVMILQTISKQFFILQLTNAILINIAIFKIIKKYTPYIFTTILIYYCTFTFIEFNFELMRETVAVAIFLLWGVNYYLKKRWIKYYFVVVLAYFFHPSSMMMFVLPIIRNFNLRTWQYVIIFVLPGLLIGLGGRIFIGNILNIVLGEDAYATEYFSGGKENNFNYFLMYAYRPSALLLLYLVFKKYVIHKEFIPVFFFSIFFMYVGALVYTAARFVNYVIIIDYVLIGSILYSLARKFKTIIVMPIYLFLLYLPNIYQYTTPETLARHYPYRSIFYDKPTHTQKIVESRAKRGLR